MPNRINIHLIAPCGMNCAVCRAYLRPHNPCHGCNDVEQNKPKTRAGCSLRLCDKRSGDFCYECAEFPCDRLKRLDLRYRTRYGMSEIENLEHIRDNGMRSFLAKERKRWISDRGVFCVHDQTCYKFAVGKTEPGKGKQKRCQFDKI
jgi:hypothetical protein